MAVSDSVVAVDSGRVEEGRTGREGWREASECSSHKLNLHIVWIIPLVSMTSLTIASVAPSNVNTALESSAVLDPLILTTNLGG